MKPYDVKAPKYSTEKVRRATRIHTFSLSSITIGLLKSNSLSTRTWVSKPNDSVFQKADPLVLNLIRQE